MRFVKIVLMLPILKQIDNASKEVYAHLGTGYSEAVYHKAMEAELRLRKIQYSTKSPISILYKEFVVGYNEPDLIVNYNNSKVVVELKATTYAPRSLEKAQLQSYLRTLDTPFGILINFPQPTSKPALKGIHFIHYGFQDDEIGEIGETDESVTSKTIIPTLNI